MPVSYSMKYLPMKGRYYHMNSDEQASLAERFPERDVEYFLSELAAYLRRNPDVQQTSRKKTKQLIRAWFSGASATRKLVA